MRIVFMGTPEFAVSSLDSLIKNKFNIVGVVTAPDKPAGRGQQLKQSAVKKYAVENDLKLLQPENLKDKNFLSELKNLKADMQIVVAFRMLPEIVWAMPQLGTYNLHASLLPKYRGAAPINWAIINGETETGVTTFKLKQEVDTGSILFYEKVKIGPATTAGELHDTLMKTGAGLIIKTVSEIQKSYLKKTRLIFFLQEEKNVSHAPKIFRENCKINWHKPAVEIYNLIRGLSPNPTAFSEIINEGNEPQLVKIFNSKLELTKHDGDSGYLLHGKENVLKVYCEGGIIEITDLQLQGKKRMQAAEFVRGFKIGANARFKS